MLERKRWLYSGILTMGVLFLGVLMQPARAQVLYSTIVGTVKDPSGAAVPGANVTVTQEQTGLTRSVMANTSGGYTVSTLPSGTYNVKVTAKGFKTFSRSGVDVAYNSMTRVDARLVVGKINQTVEVGVPRPFSRQTVPMSTPT